MKRNRAEHPKQLNQGFSLLEVLVSLSLIGIIAAGFVTSFTGQQDTHLSSKQIVEMQQSVRSALYIMTREIRMAGYDPYDGDAGAGITSAGNGTGSASALTFTYVADDDGLDNDGDGTTDEEGELKTISFYLYNDPTYGNNALGMRVGNGTVQAIAANLVNSLDPVAPVYLPSQAGYVPTFNFYYYDTNMANTADPTQVAFVRINLVVGAAAGTTDYTGGLTRTVTSLVRLRN